MGKSPDKSLMYSKIHLRNMLVERRHEKTYFISQEQWSDVLCFNDKNASIATEYNDNAEDVDKTKIINTAVELIKNDISLLEIDSLPFYK